jgi:hypothetical protein
MYSSSWAGSNGAVEIVCVYTLGTPLMHRMLSVHAGRTMMYALSMIVPRICISTALLCTHVLHYALLLQVYQKFVDLYA